MYDHLLTIEVYIFCLVVIVVVLTSRKQSQLFGFQLGWESDKMIIPMDDEIHSEYVLLLFSYY